MIERQAQSPAELSWQSSRCQRILRPLKLKIAALERALSTSHSVSDGIAPWKDHSTRRRPRYGSDESDTSSYQESYTRLKKYGVARKQVPEPRSRVDRSEAQLTAENILASLRSSTNPSLGSAYLGVYYAFRTILEKVKASEGFPSLASRCAAVVGRCIHFTGHPFTEEPIDPDDWYEAVPTHYRSKSVVGHAVQVIASSSMTLGPLLPAFVLLMQDDPSVHWLLEALFESTDLTSCRKAEVQALQTLATRVGIPRALRTHYTQVLQIDHLRHPGFSIITQPRLNAQLADGMEILYLKTFQKALQYLSSCTGPSDLRLNDTVSSMCTRVVGYSNFPRLLRFSRDLCQYNHYMSVYLRSAFSLAALIRKPSDASLVTEVRETTHELLALPVADKEETLRLLLSTFNSDELVELVELLVGRTDDLSLVLSVACAAEFQGDFIRWADSIERDIVQVKSGGESERYRYEPLLDSWVAKTPGKHQMRIVEYTSDDDESDSDSSEADELVPRDETYAKDGYSDQSRVQLSFAELDCEEEDDDLITKPGSGKRSSLILNLLSASAKKSGGSFPPCYDTSSKILKHLSRSTAKGSVETSPLVRYSREHTQTRIPSSPLIDVHTKRQNNQILDCYEPESTHNYPTRRKKLKLTSHRSDISMPMTVLSPAEVNKRFKIPQRELKNLRTSFSASRKSKKQASGEEDKNLPVYTAVHPLSDADELSLL